MFDFELEKIEDNLEEFGCTFSDMKNISFVLQLIDFVCPL
ncbi:20695_t:CDS:2 [Rhizophagus irregularis]|nr:20695_t:CDS:2 [Rhizophagus irregularis]